MEHRRRNRQYDEVKTDGQSVPQTTTKYVPVAEHPVADTSHTQKILVPNLGNACLDCLNNYYDVKLMPKDCKISLRADGNLEVGKCVYCQRIRPIVTGLRLSGKIKMMGK